MKKLSQITGTVSFILALSASAVFGQVFTFDENGNGTVTTGSGSAPLPYTVAPDPSGGIAANVLIYQLPIFVTPGDVALMEPGATSSVPTLSDIVRFYNSTANPNGSEIIFYSDTDDTPLSLADTGLPPLSPNAIQIPEVGPEGNNGATWNPPGGAPGSSFAGVVVSYNIISDVPEPASGTLILGGLGAFLGIKRFRQKFLV